MAATTGKITINVGGRKVPLRFALWALRNTCKTLEITLEQFLEKLESSENGGISIFEMLDFYAEAIKEAANYELDVDSIPYQTRHAYEWIEELEPTSEAFKSVVKCLIESIVFNITGMTLEEAAKKAEANAALAAQIGTKKKPTGGKK